MGPLFWNAFALGLVFAAPPGALNVEALRRGLVRGFSGAFLVEVGSLIVDATWAIVALSGAVYLMRFRPASVVLAGLGSALLFWLAYRALRDAWRGRLPPPRPESRRGDLAAGVFISLTNPFTVAFWLGLGGAVSVMGSGTPSLTDHAAFFGAFMLAATSWCVFISAMIGWDGG